MCWLVLSRVQSAIYKCRCAPNLHHSKQNNIQSCSSNNTHTHTHTHRGKLTLKVHSY